MKPEGEAQRWTEDREMYDKLVSIVIEILNSRKPINEKLGMMTSVSGMIIRAVSLTSDYDYKSTLINHMHLLTQTPEFVPPEVLEVLKNANKKSNIN